MIKLIWENEKKNMCVVCSEPLTTSSFWVCKKCNRVCEIAQKEEVIFGVYDVKSKCCKADVDNNQKLSCSDKCHEVLVNTIENKMGQYKKIIDQSTNKAYRVPTKEIIEKGLRQEDLVNYPEWS